jgi:hypothetical protein
MTIDLALKEAMSIPGAVGVTLVDYDSGMSLGSLGGGDWLDLDVAAAGNTEVVRAKLRVMASLGLDDSIEDILITLHRQYHVIRPLSASGNLTLFRYLVLDRDLRTDAGRPGAGRAGRVLGPERSHPGLDRHAQPRGGRRGDAAPPVRGPARAAAEVHHGVATEVGLPSAGR